MTERKYAIEEIDALRRCAENKFIRGSYSGPSARGPGNCNSPSYSRADLLVFIEQTTRTHMLAGLTAEDLREGGGETFRGGAWG